MSNTYDSLNNLTKSTLPTGAATTFTYGSASNPHAPSQATDAQGNTSTFSYDAAGNATSTTDSTPGQGKTTIDRNSDGQPRQETDPKGNVTTYNYNLLGELTSINRPAPLGDESRTYDGLSRLATVTTGAGNTKTYTYDALDRVTRVTGTGATTTTSTYDEAGNRTQQSDATGTTTSNYDALNRVTAQNPAVGGPASYTYDGAGNLLTHTDTAGAVSYRYDAGNNADQATEPDGQLTSFGYNNEDQRVATTWPGGVKQATDYDASGRITRVRGTNPAGQSITDLVYTYRVGSTPTDDRTQVQTAVDQTTNQSTAYRYDKLTRLTRVQTKNGAGTVTKTYDYLYDSNGNRTRSTVDGTATTAAFNAADQLCWTAAGTPIATGCPDASSSATRYGYDPDGNQTTTTSPNDPAATATFNAYGQTTGFNPSGQPASAPAYTGVTQNGRASTTDQLGTTTRQLTFTRTVLGVTARTATNPDAVDAYTRDPRGQLLTWRAGTTKRAYLTDRQGSVVAVVNLDGTVDRRYTYDPYGATTKTFDTERYDTNPWRYTGEYQDNTTGLYKLGARYLDPTLGRFTQPDPSGQEANTYLYVGANPCNSTDPRGLSRCQTEGLVTGIGFGALTLGVGLSPKQAPPTASGPSSDLQD